MPNKKKSQLFMSNQSKVNSPEIYNRALQMVRKFNSMGLNRERTDKKFTLQKYVYTFNYILWVTNAWDASGENVDFTGECTIQYAKAKPFSARDGSQIEKVVIG